MNLPSSCSTQPGRGGFGLRPDPFIARKQQALALHLVRQLADTQFRRADAAGSERLWQEVALLEIDPERITALLYSGIDPNESWDPPCRRRRLARCSGAAEPAGLGPAPSASSAAVAAGLR